MPSLIDSMISTIHLPHSVIQRGQAAAQPSADQTRPTAGNDVAEISMAGRLALAREADSVPAQDDLERSSLNYAAVAAEPDAQEQAAAGPVTTDPEDADVPTQSPDSAATTDSPNTSADDDSEQEREVSESSDRPTAADGSPLSESELQQLQELQERDRAVRAHEQAHAAAAGALAMGGPSYHYQRGPDGRNYAVGGEVKIDSGPVPGDPEATIRKMEQVRRAALAPVDPSPADRAVASQADRQASVARMELLMQQAEARQNSSLSNADTTDESQSQDDETQAVAVASDAQALQMNMALQALSPAIA